ncbi:MAG TPA: tRNA uridine-5-carboxymethylaminomethyl(34) synthesis GTPase MnmE [Geobacteraceae bacterium]
MYHEDTIAAISTPTGEGGIGIIRMSGPGAEAIVSALIRQQRNGGLTSHRFYYDSLVDPLTGACVDEVMVVLMRAPRSYTREDVVEVQCHGGTLVTERILDLVLRQGARLAEPGEFTKRAFLNGRIDLVQAEAVIDIIRSRTDSALALAQGQRQGELSHRIGELRQRLVEALAILEAYLDFPEDEIDSAAAGRIGSNVLLARGTIEELLAGFDEGRVLREGVAVLIAGKPNVGKSSLLNLLLREKRAIVTAVPGTTRDTIEEVINMAGLPVRLIDTAGIRATEDIVEREGVRLTLEKIPLADLVLFVVDNSRPFDADDDAIRDALSASRVVVVRSKSDLPPLLELPLELQSFPAVEVSTATEAGLDTLRDRIVATFLRDPAADRRSTALLSRVRHRDALAGAHDALVRFQANLSAGFETELLAVDLRDALTALGQVTGQTTPDDILDVIFSQFCIGK